MKILVTNCLCCVAFFLLAQSPDLFPNIPKSNEFSYIYPQYVVDIQAVVKQEYTRMTQWYETYQKGETDESGAVWSQPVLSYQVCALSLSSKGIENATYYDPENNRLRRLDYYYINGLLSAIDEFRFDAAQKERLILTDVYFYEADGRPVQRTRQFAKDKALREMLTYRFDVSINY